MPKKKKKKKKKEERGSPAAHSLYGGSHAQPGTLADSEDGASGALLAGRPGSTASLPHLPACLPTKKKKKGERRRARV